MNEENEKRCPLGLVNCNASCGWWDEDRNQCAVKTIANALHKAVKSK